MDNYGFLKVAAAKPKVKVADCDYNAKHIISMAESAAQRGVEVVAFPELATTSATCGELFSQQMLIDGSDCSLHTIARATRKLALVIVVGAPVRYGSRLYSCGVVMTQGRILGIVPKSYLHTWGDGNEGRWFESGAGIEQTQIPFLDSEVDFGCDVTFEVNGVEFGIEIGDDMWSATPPSSQTALGGAKVIFNLSSAADTVGSYDKLVATVKSQSQRTLSAYVYTSSGFGESSSGAAFSGNAIIAEAGKVLRKSERFSLTEQLTVADVDIDLISSKRQRNVSFKALDGGAENTVIEIEIPEAIKAAALDRDIDPTPFIPKTDKAMAERSEEVFHILSHALAQRLQSMQCTKAVIAISGGLDSTLTLLATVDTFDKLGIERKNIIGITMPGFGTTDRTYNNACTLMQELGIDTREISIREACTQHFSDIGLDASKRDVAYENSQARERTQIGMDIANMEGAIFIGTGDLSETALGWSTYGGDQMSMYGLIGSVPKTLIGHLICWWGANQENKLIEEALKDIAATPISPELLPPDKGQEIAQKTELIVGPYELHDFFIYNFIGSGYSPSKILFLAEIAFKGKYDRATILKWLTTFIRRFFTQQFKRAAAADGPAVGSINLSSHGAWQMPCDVSPNLWLSDLADE